MAHSAGLIWSENGRTRVSGFKLRALGVSWKTEEAKLQGRGRAPGAWD